MKVYEILTTIVVEDVIDKPDIIKICNDLEEAVRNRLFISNQMCHYELKETIDYPDGTRGDKDYEKAFDNWVTKSQQVIDRIRKEKQEP